MKKLFVVTIAILGTSLNSFGEGRRESSGSTKSLHDQFTGQGYGLAGCGLGSVIFGPKPGMIQVFASTTNGSYSNHTFGISSGTSNCDIPEMGAQAAAFIEVNKEIVKKESARGTGETLTDLAAIFNCQNTAEFSAQIKENYQNIFADKNDSYESSRQILRLIDKNPKMSCSAS